MSIKWKTIKEFTDIKYEAGTANASGIAKITIDLKLEMRLGHKLFLDLKKHLH